MIQLTRLNSKPIIINSDLIELIDETPDTIITLTTGRRILVAEAPDLVVERIIAFRSRCRKPNGFAVRRDDGKASRAEPTGFAGRRDDGKASRAEPNGFAVRRESEGSL